MKVLFAIGDLQPESGGPSHSVSELAAALAKLGDDVEVIALQYGGSKPAPMIPEKPVQTTLVPCRRTLAEKIKWTPRFKVTLRARCQSAKTQILHDNGLWLPTNHAAAAVSRDLKIPRIVSPRGMLTKWALQHRGWKKRLAWRFYQHRDLLTAQVLHATAHQEAAEFRALGLTQPIAVIPNGVRLPENIRNSKTGIRNSEPRTILFLGRIHPVKGLMNLVAAWAAVNQPSETGNRKSGEWRVVVAGGDENGHLTEVQAEIRKRKLENSFEFVGEVADAAKWNLYRNADLFVLPSHSENFGIVIAEALACGVPVITTCGTPWEDLITHRCGWRVEIGTKPLAEALEAAMKLPDEERQAMGFRGRKLVEENYTWPAAANKMVAVYQWMLESGPKPKWVI